MEIDKTIEKWFEETFTQIECNVKTGTKIDSLLISSLKASENYCNAILLLLEKKHKMPVKALLRVLFELNIKLMWCLFDSGGDINNDDIIDTRVQGWIKSSHLKTKKDLEAFVNAVDEESKQKIENMIRSQEEKANTINYEKMPNFKKICEALPDDLMSKARPLFYAQFNNAIHLDPKSLGDLIKKKGNNFLYLSDSKDNINDLVKYCVSHAHDINALIRIYYRWSTDEMDKENKSIIQGLSRQKTN